MKLIGRKNEIDALERYESSGEPEFIVVYGRRRVGKTFLVKEYFDDHFFFYFTGIANATMPEHLERFSKALEDYGQKQQGVISSWMEAFDRLTELIVNAPTQERKVVFLDEMPWMDTPKASFLQSLEYFWNSFASRRKDLLFIVCGSATSWMTKKLFKNRGGLHNRITGKIHVSPFTLAECEEYMQAKGISLGRYDIVEFYMIFGGVPYYLSYLDGRYSLAQNVDRMLFYKDAPLEDEFESLYASLFKDSDRYIQIVTALSKKTKGLTREELLDAVSLKDGGSFSLALEDLELSGFIRKYYAFPTKTSGALYQLIDNFTLFHQGFMDRSKNTDEHFWTNLRDVGKLNAWRGYAFEQVCLHHVDKIKAKLGISGVLTNTSSWKSKHSSPGAQIDLILDRNDNLINLCEMKYSQFEYEITKTEEANLRNKLAVFTSETKTRKSIHITLVSTYGVKRNKHSGIINSEVIMDDLFE
jgi:AAA+ ATPase superfamily predicted ATPase